jgi:hypothetical protein
MLLLCGLYATELRITPRERLGALKRAFWVGEQQDFLLRFFFLSVLEIFCRAARGGADCECRR